MELTIGERIRFVRKFRGITQTELAEKVGLPPGENGRIRISQYENGTYVPKEEMLERISQALGVTSSYLSSKPQTKIIDFVFHLMEYDRDMPMTIEKNSSSYTIIFRNSILENLFDEWTQKKIDLKIGRISNDEYIEWMINYDPYEK